MLHAVDQKFVQSQHRLSAVDRNGEVLVQLVGGIALGDLVEIGRVVWLDHVMLFVGSHRRRLKEFVFVGGRHLFARGAALAQRPHHVVAFGMLQRIQSHLLLAYALLGQIFGHSIR